jgi:hypothetical protein
MQRTFAPLLLILPFLAAALGGCVAPAGTQAMSVGYRETRLLEGTPALSGRVLVGAVTGGQATNELWVSHVGAPEFAGALEASLAEAGLLAATPAEAAWVLDAEILGEEQVVTGLDTIAALTVRYRLLPAEGDAAAHERELRSQSAAVFGQAWYGPTRYRKAIEAAARANLAELLAELYAIDE